MPLHCRPTLVLHFDEASPNIVMYCWLLYHMGLRVMAVRDVFHREWNDVQLAVKATGLWHVVLLSSLAFNLPYGPWDGSKWSHLMLEAARDLCAHEDVAGPLFSAFYELICQDRGETPSTLAHKQQALRELSDHRAFLAKGPRTALRRWFSWMQSASWHDGCWHARLLACVYLGIRTGAYKSHWDCPFWSHRGYAPPATADGQDGDQEATADREAAAANVSGAAASSSGAAAAPEAGQEDAPGGVRHGDDELAALRKKCKNTVYVACAVLSEPGLQTRCRILESFCRPVYTAHSSHAASVRGPADALQYYLRNAGGAYQTVLCDICRLLVDLPTLSYCRFATELRRFSKDTPDIVRELQEQEELADTTFRLVVHLLRFRASSMAWHCCWPGAAALFTSPDRGEQEEALRLLRLDYSAYCAACEYSGASSFLAKVCKKNAFSTTLMSEMAAFACLTPDAEADVVLPELASHSRLLFTGFGQTKVIEDGIKEVRDRADRDVCNKRLACVHQWKALQDTRVLGKHGREELAPPAENMPARGKVPWSAFSSYGSTPSMDCSSLVETATWPSLTAQSMQVVCAEQQLFRHCLREGDWEKAEDSWKCNFVRAGAVMQNVASGDLVLALGSVQYVALVTWALRDVGVTADGMQLLQLETRAEPRPLSWEVVLDWDTWHILPCAPVSPAGLFRALGKKLPKTSGVVLLQKSATALPILRVAAKAAFWDLPKFQLVKLAGDLGLACHHVSVYEVVKALVEHVLAPLAPDELEAILRLRGVVPAPKMPEGIPPELIEEVAGTDAAEAVEEPLLHQSGRCRANVPVHSVLKD